MLNLIKKKHLIVTLIIMNFLCCGAIYNKAEEGTIDMIFPDENWTESIPEDQGLDGEKLDSLIDYIEEEELDINSFLVIRNGYLVFEYYNEPNYVNTQHFLWSVTKSFTSALVGIAIDQGYITDLQTPIIETYFSDKIIENWDYRKENITVEHLLTMSSGFEWSDFQDYTDFVNNSDAVGYVLGKPLTTTPGEQFNYNTGASHILSAIIEESVGNSTLNFAIEHLFNKIGIKNYSWDEDKEGRVFGGHGLYMTARDMARFGHLYLNKGQWNDQRIVSESWVELTTKVYWTILWNMAYGHHWWVYPRDNLYAAMGFLQQCIFVSEENNIVVAIQSIDLEGKIDPLQLVRNYVIGAILEEEKEEESEETSFGIMVIVPVVAMLILRKKRKESKTS